jgi:hypothetical protein
MSSAAVSMPAESVTAACQLIAKPLVPSRKGNRLAARIWMGGDGASRRCIGRPSISHQRVTGLNSVLKGVNLKLRGFDVSVGRPVFRFPEERAPASRLRRAGRNMCQ